MNKIFLGAFILALFMSFGGVASAADNSASAPQTVWHGHHGGHGGCGPCGPYGPWR